MSTVPIARQTGNLSASLHPTDFTIHTFPFADFPSLRSHIHPRFVICNTGPKLVRNPIGHPYFKQHPDFETNLPMAMTVYEAWTKKQLREQPPCVNISGMSSAMLITLVNVLRPVVCLTTISSEAGPRTKAAFPRLPAPNDTKLVNATAQDLMVRLLVSPQFKLLHAGHWTLRSSQLRTG